MDQLKKQEKIVVKKYFIPDAIVFVNGRGWMNGYLLL